jgi:mRNA interferase MazF
MAKVPNQPHRQTKKVTSLGRGEIYLCSFGPTVGHEIRKTRPALIIQNDVGNRYSPLTIVAAITSTVSRVPYLVEVVIEPTAANGLDVPSSIRLDQIRTFDRRCLVRRLGVVDLAAIAKVDQALKISLGLTKV